jgi:hypothetical protein
MRPRIFPDSQQQLASACEALSRRVSARPEQPQPKDYGPLVATVLVIMVTLSLIGYGWNQMISHAMPLAESQTVLAKHPVRIHGELWEPDQVHNVIFPDGLKIQVRYVGETEWGRRPASVQLGDMIKYDGHFWIWMKWPGQSAPTWVDP